MLCCLRRWRALLREQPRPPWLSWLSPLHSSTPGVSVHHTSPRCTYTLSVPPPVVVVSIPPVPSSPAVLRSANLSTKRCRHSFIHFRHDRRLHKSSRECHSSPCQGSLEAYSAFNKYQCRVGSPVVPFAVAVVVPVPFAVAVVVPVPLALPPAVIPSIVAVPPAVIPPVAVPPIAVVTSPFTVVPVSVSFAVSAVFVSAPLAAALFLRRPRHRQQRLRLQHRRRHLLDLIQRKQADVSLVRARSRVSLRVLRTCGWT
eukprot:6755249-Pyramimonas_sp.AAC.1